MDADHNRCVITLVGDPVNVAEAAIRGVGKAAELIDLTKHTGAHPRLGAADVIPFIPIEALTLEDCVAIARRVGEEIWKRWKVPVYLYEAAAQIPERQNLENVRRGQFEGIREEVKTNRARKPDFGEAALHPTAGATVVGARKFLVAYNVYLNTPDVEIAKKIGKAVRFSNGGLRYVKGMGVGVRGLAQVSMNLTDTDQTPIARVYEYVKREAARYGVMPLASEIVGLIPKKALEDAAEWFLQIENFDSSLILENRLVAVMSGKLAVGGIRAGVEPFIEQLAAPTAAPGGGSASAATAAMAAALGSMVAGMSRGKKAYAQYERPLTVALARLAELREQFKAAIDADAESFNEVMAAFKKAKDHPEAQVEVEAATKKATLIPLGVAERAREVRQMIESLRPMTNPRMASDLTVGVSLARAAAEGALANVEINLNDIKDEVFLADVKQRVTAVRS
jgi:glutamate formiminotransferase